MGRLGIVAVIVAALGLAACGGPPESRIALSGLEGAADGAAYVGNWYQPVEGGAFHLRITAREDSPTLDATMFAVGWEEGNAVRWLRASVHLTEIDGRTYANIRRESGVGDDYTAPGERPGFIIARVSLSPEGELLMAWMSSGALQELIAEGRAQGGEVEGVYEGETVPYLLLSMDRDPLVALVRAVPGDRLFDEPGVFTRLPDAGGD